MSADLNAALASYHEVQFERHTDAFHSGDPRHWPHDVIDDLILAETQWRAGIGRIVTYSRQYACVPFSKWHACITRIFYSRASDETVASRDVSPGTEESGGVQEPSSPSADASLSEVEQVG